MTRSLTFSLLTTGSSDQYRVSLEAWRSDMVCSHGLLSGDDLWWPWGVTHRNKEHTAVSWTSRLVAIWCWFKRSKPSMLRKFGIWTSQSTGKKCCKVIRQWIPMHSWIDLRQWDNVKIITSDPICCLKLFGESHWNVMRRSVPDTRQEHPRVTALEIASLCSMPGQPNLVVGMVYISQNSTWSLALHWWLNPFV